MAYIGREPIYGLFEKQVLSPSSGQTLFELDYSVGSSTSILVVDGGVVKNPDVDYTIVDGGGKIEFSTSPSNAYIIYLGKQLQYPQFGKHFSVIDLSANITLTASQLPDILSVNPIAVERTVFLPLASESSGYQFIVRNRSATHTVVLNAGIIVTNVLPGQTLTIASDSLDWFVVA